MDREMVALRSEAASARPLGARLESAKAKLATAPQLAPNSRVKKLGGWQPLGVTWLRQRLPCKR